MCQLVFYAWCPHIIIRSLSRLHSYLSDDIQIYNLQIIIYYLVMSEKPTKYWQFIVKEVTKIDLGHICKQCKKPFTKINQPMAVRRGGRIQLKYHADCFSGHADPRTQHSSTFNKSKWAGSQQIHAPKQIYKKMRTESHF